MHYIVMHCIALHSQAIGWERRAVLCCILTPITVAARGRAGFCRAPPGIEEDTTQALLGWGQQFRHHTERGQKQRISSLTKVFFFLFMFIVHVITHKVWSQYVTSFIKGHHTGPGQKQRISSNLFFFSLLSFHVVPYRSMSFKVSLNICGKKIEEDMTYQSHTGHKQ